MNTMIEQIKQYFDMFKGSLEYFLSNHSYIDYRTLPQGFIGFSNYEWRDLEQEGRKRQSKLYKEYVYIVELMNVLISDLPNEYKDKFNTSSKEIFSYIEQDTNIWFHSIDEVLNEMNNNLNMQFELLNNLYSCNEGIYLFVPDTNALLFNQYLDKWHFTGVSKFEIVLTPTVLSELDELKILGRNEEVRNKATSIIRTMKEYRRRGSIIDGVVLKKDTSYLRTLAVEPNFENAFSWLDKDNKDDRLLISFVEIVKQYPNSIVQLVTGDINLQNKAEYAKLPFVEPPEITNK